MIKFNQFTDFHCRILSIICCKTKKFFTMHRWCNDETKSNLFASAYYFSCIFLESLCLFILPNILFLLTIKINCKRYYPSFVWFAPWNNQIFITGGFETIIREAWQCTAISSYLWWKNVKNKTKKFIYKKGKIPVFSL